LEDFVLMTVRRNTRSPVKLGRWESWKVARQSWMRKTGKSWTRETRKRKWGEEGEEVGERPGINGHFADEAKEEEELAGKEKDGGKHEGGDKNYLLSSFLHKCRDQYIPRK